LTSAGRIDMGLCDASRDTFIVTAPLSRSIARRVKEAVRRVRWAVRPPSVARPTIPADVGSVLFVCLGNICRSPFAAVVAQRHLNERGATSVTCTSAGLQPSAAGASPPEACAASARYGVSLHDHRPRPVTRALVDSCDLIVVMERAHAEDLREAYPDRYDRVVLLPLFDGTARGYQRYSIEDPFGQTPEVYDDCYRRIQRAVAELIGQIVRPPADARSSPGRSRTSSRRS
jgi:protein-tyrosine-phosphatase